MKLKHIFWCVTLLVSTMACKKEEIILFDREDAGIYFQFVTSRIASTGVASYADTYNLLLQNYSTSVELARSLPIWSMGNVKDYPRPVKIVIDEENTTMVKGVHFEADLSETVIAPGESMVNLDIKILRDDDFIGKELKLVFRLEDNEHFNAFLQTQKASNVYTTTAAEISANTFTFVVSEIYTENTYWTYFGTSYFGTFSLKKFVFINNFMGWPHYDWTVFNTGAVSLVSLPVAAPLVRAELQKLANAGTPMREDDGTLMQLGASFRVDYSAYE